MAVGNLAVGNYQLTSVGKVVVMRPLIITNARKLVSSPFARSYYTLNGPGFGFIVFFAV